MRVIVTLFLAGALLTGCNRPAATAPEQAAPVSPAGPAHEAETADPKAHMLKNQLESGNGKQAAVETIHDFGIPCAVLTQFGFLKVIEAGKVFRAQCDDKEWYLLIESPDGPIKVIHWSGAGDPS